MKLMSLSVGGYKNLAKTTVELEGLTALISPNNYGKSNLLGALQFAIEFLNASPKTRSAMMAAEGCVPLTPALENENFSFSMMIDNQDIGENYRFARYGFEFEWIKDNESGRKIVNESIEIGPKPNERLTTYLKRKEGKYKKSYDTRSFRAIALDDNQLAIDVLTSMEDIDINPVVRQIKSMVFAILASIDATNRFRATPIEFNAQGEGFDFDDGDLPRALYRLKEGDSDRYGDFLNAVHTLFPEFSALSVQSYEMRQEDKEFYERAFPPDDASVPFHVKDELYKLMIKSEYLNQPVSVARMSEGTQRLIWLIASVVIANMEKISCVGIEEVETSIHPKMLKTLLEILSENISGISVLLTSHSPYLIQYLKPEHIYIGVPSGDGVAAFKRIRKERVKEVSQAAYERGLSFGEYIFELLTLDGDDKAVLRRWLED